MIREVLREALLILAAATILGFVYTGTMGKGLFQTPKTPTAEKSVGIVVPPDFISLEEAVQLHKEGGALFVDSRYTFDFNLGHVEGAVNIPLKDFVFPHPILDTVPKERLIVAYCDGADCNSSVELATKLSQAGFTHVRIFFGGWTEWKAHHLATEGPPK